MDQFFDQMTSGKVPLRILPGMIAWTLRGDEKFSVNAVGVKRAVELATAQAGSTLDSAGAAPPAIQPAPGPAPLPGAKPEKP